ncbi:6964_t:CDS:2 [Acaulospora morrowiae]|uniref:DASH complex subunit DAD3 n=1 Tax=Acaulospora morrowiae TaxID=94023 RepID=A0A9N8Z9Q0_9GLOM|nr:6964_t:CDS:2 [Acaulospora morrowiae]
MFENARNSVVGNTTISGSESVVTLEKDIITEYEKLVTNVDRMNQIITHMNTTEVLNLINKLRTLEKKVGLVYTLFKASVYSLVTADQDIGDGSGVGDGNNIFGGIGNRIGNGSGGADGIDNNAEKQQSTNRPIF